MKRLLPLALLFLLIAYPCMPCLAQAGHLPSEEYDEAICDVLPLPEGGLLLIGYFIAPIGEEGQIARCPLVRRVDGEGNVLWVADIAGESQWDYFGRGAMLEDGRIRLLREVVINPAEGEIENRITTLSPGGALEAEISLPAWANRVVFAGEQTYLVGEREPTAAEKAIGYVLPKLIIGKIDASGNLLWKKDIHVETESRFAQAGGTVNSPLINGAISAGDGLLLFGNSSNHFTVEKGWLGKLDSNGEMIWEYKTGGNDYVTAAYVQPDGSVVGVGTRMRSGVLGDLTFVFNVESDGGMRFEKIIEIEADAYLRDILPLDGGYWVLGKSAPLYPYDFETMTPEGPRTPLLIRLDSEGNLEFSERIHGECEYYRFIDTQDGGALVFGDTLMAKPGTQWRVMTLEELVSQAAAGLHN